MIPGPGATIVRRKPGGRIRCVLILSVQPGYDSFSNVLTKDGISFIENASVDDIPHGVPSTSELTWGELR